MRNAGAWVREIRRGLFPKRLWLGDFGRFGPGVYRGRRGFIVKGTAFAPYAKQKARRWGCRVFWLGSIYLSVLNFDKFRASEFYFLDAMESLAEAVFFYTIPASAVIWVVALLIKMQRYRVHFYNDGRIRVGWTYVIPTGQFVQVVREEGIGGIEEQRQEQEYLRSAPRDAKAFPTECRDSSGVSLHYGVRGEYYIRVAWFEKAADHMKGRQRPMLLTAALERTLKEAAALREQERHVPLLLWWVFLGWPFRRVAARFRRSTVRTSGAVRGAITGTKKRAKRAADDVYRKLDGRDDPED